MIIFDIKSENPKLIKAGLFAQEFFKQLKLADVPDSYNYTNDNGATVFLKISAFTNSEIDHKVVVREYKPWYRWSKAIGYAQYSTIFVNSYKIDYLETEDYVNNFVHETMHLIGYQHNGNRVTQFNLKTVPYVIGALAEAWVRGRPK